MPKYMNNMYTRTKMNLQLFAGDEDTGDDTGEGDDQDDAESDEDGEEEPKFTQADIDKAISRTIAKERRKAERVANKEKGKSGDTAQKENGESEESKARQEAEKKALKLEMKVACFEAGVVKDAIEDVTALAHAYMEAEDDLDLEEAIEKVVKKYPQFTKEGTDPYEGEEQKGKSWGQRQTGRTKNMSGVESRFYELNPDLKK